MSARQELENMEKYKNLTQTGFDLEIFRLDSQINLFKQKIKDLSWERINLIKAAGTNGLNNKIVNL